MSSITWEIDDHGLVLCSRAVRDLEQQMGRAAPRPVDLRRLRERRYARTLQRRLQLLAAH
jgi:hypothetical protein